jgi:hypothetical protein
MQCQHAIRNNIALYEAVLAGHGAAGRLEEHFWASDERVPPYYGNLVTRTRKAGEAAQWERLKALTARPPKPDWGFKDSFARLNPRSIEGLGLRLLFEARWYGLKASCVMPSEPAVDAAFERVGDEHALTGWEAAWQRSSPADGRVFPPSLLRDQNLTFLSSIRHGQVVGGALLNLSGPSVGLSNLFTLDDRDRSAFARAAARAARERYPLTKVVEINHRALIQAVTEQRHLAFFNHGKEQGLACRLKRTIEPGRANYHQFQPEFGSVIGCTQFHLHFRAAITLVRVVRRVFVEAVLGIRVTANRRVGRDNHRALTSRMTRGTQ